jgi:hypothetical protein
MPIYKSTLNNTDSIDAYSKEKAFFDSLTDFIVQCVSGQIMNTIRFLSYRPNEDPFAIASMLVKKYMNICWHGYGKKNDEYVIKVIDEALSHNVIKGSVCLLMWIHEISLIMLEKLQLPKLISELECMPMDIKRIIANILTEGLYKNMALPFKNIRCEGDKCDHTYNNMDLYLFSDSVKQS